MNKFFELTSIETAVHFRILKPGINRFNVGLYDKESDLPIYIKKNWDLQEGIVYFVGPSATLSKPRTIYLKIESHEGEEVQTENINYGTGPSRYPVVLGKKYKFSHNDRDAAFFTLLEVFYERLYDKYFVKVEKDDVVLDIGANLGMFSAYCQNFHPDRVISVEPGEEEFPCLLENIKPFKAS